MSADKPGKPKGPTKPFLGDDELSSELDAWDEMFDNLHETVPADDAASESPTLDVALAEPSGGVPQGEWPEAAAVPPTIVEPPGTRVPEAALAASDASRTLDDFSPAFDPNDPKETDFSDVGGAEPPARLAPTGKMPAFVDMPEEGATRLDIARSPASAEDDDEVYTSASRPNVKSPPGARPLPEDPIAPPPKPAPAKRTGPAIIRRQTPVAVPLQPKPQPHTTPQRGYAAKDDAYASDFGDSTRIADYGEIEAKAEESRHADARSKAPTAPPPMSFTPSAYEQPEPDDDYEIEIGSSSDEDPPAPAPEPVHQPRRTVANVIRRDPAKSIPVPLRRESEPIIEISQPVPSGPRGEDDFSDVAASFEEESAPPRRPAAEPIREDDFAGMAAALGADPLMDEDLALPPKRPSTAPTKPPPSALHAIEDADVEDEGIIDDALPTRMIPEDRDASHSGDAYVPMTSDSLELPASSGQFDELAVPQVDDTFDAEQPATRVEGAGANRPPALMDLYPRVKRPTSVPVLGERSFDERTTADEPGMAERSAPRVVRAQTMPASQYGDTPEIEPVIDLEALGVDSQWPEQVAPIVSSSLDEEAARLLMIYEREIPTVDDPAASAALRIEAGRLCERLGDTERARVHYDAALLVDPRATAALRGLRRIARSQGDLVETTRHLDAEIAVAGALERRPLGHYRVDLLMASGEHDLARVAVGDIVDSAPSDVRALLAQLELAFVDGRADEFGRSLERLAHAVTDPQLRAAVQQARGMLAAQQSDAQGAVTWLGQATESDPGSLGARLAAIREAAAQSKPNETAHALLELANIVEESDPTTAAALAVRSQFWVHTDLGVAAASVATKALPADPLVARVAAETALAGSDTIAATNALVAWASCAAPPVERAYAAARAAELDASQGVELWSRVLQLDPGDDYAAAQLRTAYVATEQTGESIAVDRQVAADAARDRARLRAAFGMIAYGQLDEAIALLQEGRAARPTSLALAEALAEALAAAGRWSDRAQLLAELAAAPGEQLDRDVAQLRSAIAWEEAVGAASAAPQPDEREIQRATAAALAAWDKVTEQANGAAPEAHAAAIVLATRLGAKDLLGEALARAQAAERSPWASASIALRRTRLVAVEDPARAEAILGEIAGGIDDPRRTVAQLLAAARRNDVGDLATILEERAMALGDSTEAAALRLRAAQLALDAGDAMRATGLLRGVEKAMPGVGAVADLLSVARRRAGDSSGPVRVAKPSSSTGASSSDEFARIVRDADDAAERGDATAAISMYQSALEMRPGDPLAIVPLVRVATAHREAAALASLALAELRAAEAAGDTPAKADAYELLSHIDRELRNDAGSAQIALESASQADPARVDLMHRLEREYTVGNQVSDLLRLRRAELAQIPGELARDRAAMLMDTAALAERDGRPDAELGELYREALVADAKQRLALLHLESIVRRAGASEELAKLEEQIATYFEGDARSQASFYTRAGETLLELGKIDNAVATFARADQVSPGHVPALEGWRIAALKGERWTDVADAATRQASVGGEPDTRARLHHFAGVALMDKALIGEQAALAFRRALEADPAHRDAFIRLRILLEEEGSHDELAILLANRLEHEPEGPHKVDLHRALAELSRNFLTDRESAKKHYRAILESDPNDLRAHSAIADIAWEQGSWQEAADALISRARLEHDPNILRTLCFRLGLIYADRLVDVPMALKAFQRALTYNPDDIQTLERLADLATQAGEWKLALGACERLVKNEDDPDKRAAHLHRVSRIFRQGFGDMKRAERALNLALDAAPTNDEALSELVKFYRDAGDMTSVRVHLNRVAGTMRTRLQAAPQDGIAYRVISRAMSARAAVGVDGSTAVARAAAELAQLCGEAGDAERMLLAEPARTVLAPLLRSEADDILFPRSVQTELRQIFTLLGDRVAKHVGVDLRALYGVARGDRLKARESAVATHAQDVATALGFGEIDVYVSPRAPFSMVAEPTSPVSLVIGQGIAQMDSRAVRFAVGSALKLAQSHLAIPARVAPEELGVLTIALLRMFQEKFPGHGLDENAIATQAQKLKRLIPTGLATELRPFAYAIDAAAFSPAELSRDLRVAGYRAGLIASGSVVAGLAILAAAAGTDARSFLADPVAQGIIQFAVGEDHATLTR
jgi:cellulose synthase operon protein C